MKKFLILILFFPALAWAQTYTTVTATITDSDGTVWANGTWKAVFYPSTLAPMLPDGVQSVFGGSLSSSGALSVSIPANNSNGGYWTFTVCPNVSNSANFCKSATELISGSTQSLSSALSAIATAPRLAAGPGVYAYTDGEIYPTPSSGATYWNVTSSAMRVWTGSAWTNAGSTAFPGVSSDGANGLTVTGNVTAASITGPPLPDDSFFINTFGTAGICVDSVNGNDSNSGSWNTTTESCPAPKKTLSTACAALTAGQTLYLARGSYWRDECDLSGLNSGQTAVLAYGTGKEPTIDGALILSASQITVSSGYTNVYQFQWTPSGNDASGVATEPSPEMWENGTVMERVASIADVQSTPGSFYSSNTITPGTPQPIYFQPVGGTNPITDGQLYEYASYAFGLKVGSFTTGAPTLTIVHGIHTRRGSGHNGSLEVDGPAFVDDIIAEAGIIHNALIQSGTVQNSYFWKIDPYSSITGSGGTMLANYSTTSGQTAALINDVFVSDPSILTAASLFGGTSSASGYIAHGSPGAYTNIVLDGVSSYYVPGFDGDNVTNMDVHNFYCFECNTGLILASSSENMTVNGLWSFNSKSWANSCDAVQDTPAVATQTYTIKNALFILPGACSGIHTFFPQTVSVSDSAFLTSDKGQVIFGLTINNNASAGTSAITLQHVAFSGFSNYVNTPVQVGGTGATLTADYNVWDWALYGSDCLVNINGTCYQSQATYQAAFPSNDTHSVFGSDGLATLPQFNQYVLIPTGSGATVPAGPTDLSWVPQITYAQLVAQLGAM